MSGELLWGRGRATLGEIGGARAGHEADAPDPRCHQRGIGKYPNPHRDVEPFLDQIDDTIEEEQPGGDLREGFEKRDHDGHDVDAAKHGRRGYREFTAGLAMLPGKGELRRIELGEDAAAGVEIVTAGLGERQTPRSAGHEAHPDLLLEGGEVATDGCQRHAEAPGGGRQRAGLVARFIPSMRSFYLATASKDGQPYIQHRGGPPGFLHVIDDRTLAFADFSGNRQYISTGNLAENPRSLLFLMDYEHRQRVKIWGTARVVEDDPELIAKLFPEGYKARAEAAIVFTVEAWDANCPQHIPQMMFAEDVAGAIGVLQERIAALEAENARLRAGRGLEP